MKCYMVTKFELSLRDDKEQIYYDFVSKKFSKPKSLFGTFITFSLTEARLIQSQNLNSVIEEYDLTKTTLY